PPEPALLLPRHRLGRGPEPRARPGLDLAEHDAAAPGQDEVELTFPAAPVAGQHRVPPARIPGSGELLAPRPEIEPPPVDRRPAHQVGTEKTAAAPAAVNIFSVSTLDLLAGQLLHV